MSQENDRTLRDLEQMKTRVVENLKDLDEMAAVKLEFADDIEAMRQHTQMNLEGIEMIAAKMRQEAEDLGNDGTT